MRREAAQRTMVLRAGSGSSLPGPACPALDWLQLPWSSRKGPDDSSLGELPLLSCGLSRVFHNQLPVTGELGARGTFASPMSLAEMPPGGLEGRSLRGDNLSSRGRGGQWGREHGRGGLLTACSGVQIFATLAGSFCPLPRELPS